MDNYAFHKLNKWQERRLSMSEFVQYRERLRQYEFETNSGIKGVRRKKIYYYFLLPIIIIGRLINRQKLTIISDKRIHTKKPVIYACTHVGYFDIIMTFEAIKSPCWLFLGNPEYIYRTFEGWLVETNGVIYINENSKTDRRVAKETAIRLLQQNGSLLIYPEAVWNVTDNLLVMKLFRGAVDMALQAGAEIVPIAIEQYGKSFYVNIGRNIKYDSFQSDTQKLTNELRDILATLKWEIWESFPTVERALFADDYRDTFIDNILSEGGYSYTMEMIENQRYHDKSVTPPKEAYAFFNRLKPCRENAFLIGKHFT